VSLSGLEPSLALSFLAVCDWGEKINARLLIFGIRNVDVV
jgi:hypothetical protein